MDIPALSMNMSQAKLGQEINIALMKKVMDTQQTASNQMVEMIQSTPTAAPPHPYLGKQLDIRG